MSDRIDDLIASEASHLIPRDSHDVVCDAIRRVAEAYAREQFENGACAGVEAFYEAEYEWTYDEGGWHDDSGCIGPPCPTTRSMLVQIGLLDQTDPT